MDTALSYSDSAASHGNVLGSSSPAIQYRQIFLQSVKFGKFNVHLQSSVNFRNFSPIVKLVQFVRNNYAIGQLVNRLKLYVGYMVDLLLGYSRPTCNWSWRCYVNLVRWQYRLFVALWHCYNNNNSYYYYWYYYYFLNCCFSVCMYMFWIFLPFLVNKWYVFNSCCQVLIGESWLSWLDIWIRYTAVQIDCML